MNANEIFFGGFRSRSLVFGLCTAWQHRSFCSPGDDDDDGFLAKEHHPLTGQSVITGPERHRV
jgi:hypothetical protein